MIHKSDIILEADQSRVLLQPMFYPGSNRVERITRRIERLNNTEKENLLQQIYDKFSNRHKNFKGKLLQHFDQVVPAAKAKNFSETDKLLTGASLSNEYSYQAAALFNPSMVPHVDQAGLNDDEVRFIMSLRATGEGHLSSIVFHTGTVNGAGEVQLNPLSPYSLTGEYREIEDAGMEYDLSFDEDSLLEERVIFPATEVESRGMEDLRLVPFAESDNKTYLGTYTAYDGHKIQPRLLLTEDFKNFRIRSLKGSSASDKGMAVFPEKINGKYAIVSRQGGENISIMFSEDLYHWDQHELLMEPLYPFELAQLGNCGSPLKTDQGWLLLTHGVGPVREYTICAVLLDLEDPRKLIGRMDRPLIQAEGNEREGYVPNVVYSCGGMLHEGKLFIPYAMSDSRCGFAWLETEELLNEMK